MKHYQLTRLCNLFNLGTPMEHPIKVLGGLLHRMWRISTDRGAYAIKQISPHIDLANTAIAKNYNLSEEIACRFFDQGIPALPAIKHADDYLALIDGIGFLVYPWVNAHTLSHETLSEPHALKIAAVLAKMHLSNLAVPEITEATFDVHPHETLLKLINKANGCKCTFADQLTKMQDDIITLNTAYQHTLSLLKKELVVSHGDLDKKNVLWDKDENPILIDWECARKLNPTHEIVNACLDWSGITSNFNASLFMKMIKSYVRAGGRLNKDLLDAAFNGVLGNWINWMAFNIERACEEEESAQKNLSNDQVHQVLKTIAKLKDIIPDLISNIIKI